MMSTLKLLPSNIQETDQRGGCYKGGFSKFKMIPTKLAVGSSITFADFIWQTYGKQT